MDTATVHYEICYSTLWILHYDIHRKYSPAANDNLWLKTILLFWEQLLVAMFAYVPGETKHVIIKLFVVLIIGTKYHNHTHAITLTPHSYKHTNSLEPTHT